MKRIALLLSVVCLAASAQSPPSTGSVISTLLILDDSQYVGQPCTLYAQNLQNPLTGHIIGCLNIGGNFKISVIGSYAVLNTGGSGAAAWGTITGTLSNQSDLQAALNAKQNLLTLPLSVASGGTGTNSPGLLAGTNVSITGTWPNQTINSTASGTGTVTHTLGALTSGQLIIGNGGADVKIGDLSGDVSTSGTTATTLAPVGSSGTCGDTTHSCGLTFDTKGRVTVHSNNVIAGGTGIASSITSGLLSALPGTCAVADVYFATNQPAGQQFYQCSALNTWTQTLGLGPSNALAFTSGLLDITSLVPLKAAANAFTGLPSFAVGQDMIEQASGTTPAAGKLHIYANTDHTFHQVTSGGVDSALGGSPTQIVGSNGLPAAKGGTPTSAVNWIGLFGSAAGNATSIIPDGSDANITMVLSYKGAGAFQLGNVNTSTSNAIQLIDHSAGFAGMYLDIADPLSVRVGGGTGATVLKVDPSTHITTIEAPQISVVAVASLPACGGSTEGLLYAVNDAAATPVYNAVVAGGGSVHIPVYCNGTNWVNH